MSEELTNEELLAELAEETAEMLLNASSLGS